MNFQQLCDFFTTDGFVIHRNHWNPCKEFIRKQCFEKWGIVDFQGTPFEKGDCTTVLGKNKHGGYCKKFDPETCSYK